MTKYDLIDRIIKQSGLKKKEVVYIIDNFIEKIKECVKNGEKVEIRGLGTFYRAEKKPRIMYSPLAGREISVPAKSSLAFKPSKVNDNTIEKEGA